MAILLDFSGTAYAAVHVDLKKGGEPTKEYIRHIILNMIRSYNKAYRNEYGEMTICFDSKSWRQGVFPLYKWVRRKEREGDDNDWAKVYEYINEIQDDLKKHFPYPCYQAYGAEADDVIAYMAKTKREPTLIISNDKDLVCLTKYQHVDQHRPFMKNGGLFTVDDPARFEFDLIVGGDESDGIPSIRCPENFYKNKWERQQEGLDVNRAPPVTVKMKNAWWDALKEGPKKLKEVMGEELFKRYLQNKQLISLDACPDDVELEIRRSIGRAEPGNMMSAMNYMIGKRMSLLAREIKDFEVNKTPRKTQSVFDI